MLTATPDPDPAASHAVSDDDVRWMRRALLIARRGRHVHPNPMVGALVVKDGRVVGEGWHKGIGTPHAEAMAYASAGEAAYGATVYVTLEPCSHRFREDGTPRIACADRCVNAGIVRLVGAMEDPDTRVNGAGFARVRAAGIAVTVGVEEAKARALNYAYIRHRTGGLPFITHKAAMTLDGKIAAPGGDSRWVTGAAARAHVHRLRDRADAIVVGSGTVLTDDPSLTTRLPRGNGHDPIRVIIDSKLRTPPTAKVARAGTIICAAAADNTNTSGSHGKNDKSGDAEFAERRAALEASGVEIVVLPSQAGRVDVVAVSRLLAERGLLDVLLESGGELAASFWAAGLVNRALYFVAPKVIGGRAAPSPVDGAGLSEAMANAARTGTLSVRRFGSDLALEAEVIGSDVYRDH